MKLLIVILAALAVCRAEVATSSEWIRIKSPMDSSKYQEVMTNLIPSVTPRRGGRISGGTLAALGQFPHQALLITTDVYSDQFICGAGILTYNWLLTAAHCLEDIVRIQAYAGIISRSGSAVWGAAITDKANMIVHSEYNPTSVVNDIALIRLPIAITSSPYIGIINLPTLADASRTFEGSAGTIAGFGRYTDVSGPSDVLRWITRPIVANTICETVFGKANIRETNLCLDTTGGSSSCQGDSGGPLTAVVDSRTVVVGIVSFGAKSGCTLGYPAVYTRVTSYLSWISTTANIHVS